MSYFLIKICNIYWNGINRTPLAMLNNFDNYFTVILIYNYISSHILISEI